MAWRNPECHEICPFGTIFTIKDESYCFGQIEKNIPYELSPQEKFDIMHTAWLFILEGYKFPRGFINDRCLSG